jgi:starch phosphorylase
MPSGSAPACAGPMAEAALRDACRRRLPRSLGADARFCPPVRHLQKSLLIFQDLERLKKLFKDRWRPIQIIFAGKAHPADDPGNGCLQNLINLARDPRIGGRIAFVEDYGEQLAQYLVHGVDVWLNNPLPPFRSLRDERHEGCLNGVPQLSLLDGWWEEGFNGKNGWAVEHDVTAENPDGGDAEKIYRLLEEQIIPLYYQVSDSGIPLEWVRLMKETMKSAASGFSARRMVKQYIEKFYSSSIKHALED